jgi:tetratricopeptide (TPR) repeat protein
LDAHKRLPSWAFLLPAAAAFGIYIVYFLQIRHMPFARFLVANPLVYDIEARNILAGEAYGRAFFMSPLYPGFVALVYKVARPDHLFVFLAQGLLLSLNVLLAGLVSRRLIGDPAGLAASVVMALYWSFYYFAGELVPATLLLTFMLLGVLLFLDRRLERRTWVLAGGVAFAASLFIMRGLPGLMMAGPLLKGNLPQQSGGAYMAAFLLAAVFVAGAGSLLWLVLRPGRLRPLANTAGSGLLLGTAALVWGAALILAVPLVLKLLAEAVRPGPGLRGRYAMPGVFVLALAVPLAASFTHNYTAGSETAVITTTFGLNLFLGNNPASDGMDPFRFGENDLFRKEADRMGLQGGRRSRFFARQAYEYIVDHPADWARLLGRKALLSLSRFEIDNNADISERRGAWKRWFIPRLHFGIIFPLALAGMIAAFRRRGDSELPVWGWLCFTAVCIVFFVCERFRLPGIVFLIPLAVAGAVLVARGIAGRAGSAGAAVLLVLLGASASNIDFFGISDLVFPSIIVNKAHVDRLAGEYERARRLANLAISLEPYNAGAHFQLGAVEEAGGHTTDALEYYLEALERDPYHGASYRRARSILESAGVNPLYLDRYVQTVMEGGAAGELKRRIIQFAADRLPGSP